jgi:hypothetical protein
VSIEIKFGKTITIEIIRTYNVNINKIKEITIKSKKIKEQENRVHREHVAQQIRIQRAHEEEKIQQKSKKFIKIVEKYIIKNAHNGETSVIIFLYYQSHRELYKVSIDDEHNPSVFVIDDDQPLRKVIAYLKQRKFKISYLSIFNIMKGIRISWK